MKLSDSDTLSNDGPSQRLQTVLRSLPNRWMSSRTMASALRVIAVVSMIPSVSIGADAAQDSAGLAALGKLNCTACHAASEKQAAWLSPKAAPRLTEIGSRASAEWLQRHLVSPQETTPGTTMPDVLHGKSAADKIESAEALTHYLVSLSSTKFQRIAPDKAAVARGEILYHRVGCVACHAPQNAPLNVPLNVPLNGSGIEGDSVPMPVMAQKWAFSGLQKFIFDPLVLRPSGRMPAMQLTNGEAVDLAHYLLRETKLPAPVDVAFYRGRIRSLEGLDVGVIDRTSPGTGFVLEGPMLERGVSFRITAWLKVDKAGEYTFYLKSASPTRFAVSGQWVLGEESWEEEKVDEKHVVPIEAGWAELKLDYVQRGKEEPTLSLEWEAPDMARGPIPVSRLSSERVPVTAEPPAFVVDKVKAEKGRALYAALSCATCHESKPPAQPLPALSVLDATRGCLSEKPAANAPDYHLDTAQRAALRGALASLNRVDLAPPSSQERVTHTLTALNCVACHVRDGLGGVKPARDSYFTSNIDDLGDEGRIPPRLDGVGDKLRPDWIKAVLTKSASVRPYMNTRMPQFGEQNVGHLADLLVELDRHAMPLVAVADTAVVQREAGRQLTGTDGLSCIACHRFNRQPAHALQVLDLTTSSCRLNEDWFRQFLRDPNRFHPGTRMPSLWPNGRSLLPAVLGGDTERQFAALWTYFADGSAAKFPEGLSRKNMEIVVGGEPIVYRGKLTEAGFRGIAIGYPGQVSTGFDAEDVRLANVWRGRFLDASLHWSGTGMGRLRPLGTDEIVFPPGTPFAVLTNGGAPWPVESGKVAGMTFTGYKIDDLNRPVLLYAFRDLNVADLASPMKAGESTGLHRELKFSGPTVPGLYLRLAVGKLTVAGANAWRLNEALTLTVRSVGKALVRGRGEQQELLVPVEFSDNNHSLEIEYVW